MDIVIYLVTAATLITIGVIIANLVLESNAIRKLSPLIKPFCRASHLPKECVFSLFASFFNPTAGQSTLVGFHREGKIGDEETILTVVMCTFPIVIGESLLRVQAPIALVLLGPYIGGIYICLNLFSAFLQSCAAFVYSRLRFPVRRCFDTGIEVNLTETSRDQKLKTALKKSVTTLKKIIPIMVVSFLIVDLLFALGAMDYISSFFFPVLNLLDLPGECITVLIADLAHFSAGYATVAALMAKGVLNAKQAIITLLIGSMLITTLVYLKISLPMYISLFGRLGMKMVVINYLCSIVAKVFVIALVVTCM